jgi:hypothetical protein
MGLSIHLERAKGQIHAPATGIRPIPSLPKLGQPSQLSFTNVRIPEITLRALGALARTSYEETIRFQKGPKKQGKS